MMGLKVFIAFFILAPLIMATMSDELEALDRKISDINKDKKVKKHLIREKKQEPKETYDMAFIRKNAYEEVYRKCVERTTDREMPYVSVSEMEEIINNLKKRKEK